MAQATSIGLGLRRVVEILAARGIDPQPLLRRAGLAAPDPTSRDLLVPAQAEATLIELAAQTAGDAILGIAMVEGVNPRDAGLLYYLFSTAATLRQALTLLARYVPIANAGLALTISSSAGGDAIVELRHVGLQRSRLKHAAEFQTAVLVKMARQIVDRQISPAFVSFAHRRSFGIREIERYFDCPVRYGAEADLIAISSESLDLRVAYADDRLLELLEPYGDRIVAARGHPCESLRAAVENIIQKLLPDGQARLDAIAAALGTSSRSLSRRLAEEGVSFSEVLDDLRRTLSLQYLADPDLSVDRAANLLGYGDVGAFTHAFRRWTGHTPSQARGDPQMLAHLNNAPER